MENGIRVNILRPEVCLSRPLKMGLQQRRNIHYTFYNLYVLILPQTQGVSSSMTTTGNNTGHRDVRQSGLLFFTKPDCYHKSEFTKERFGTNGRKRGTYKLQLSVNQYSTQKSVTCHRISFYHKAGLEEFSKR